MVPKPASEHAKALSAMGAAKGGKARAARLTGEQRREIARQAAAARWRPGGGAKNAAAATAARGSRSLPGGSVTTPKGFLAGATYAGLKTYAKDKLDLGLLFSEAPCAAAGVFTQSTIVSATVPLARERVMKGKARAIVVNSGCANACVGPQGMADAREMAALAAKKCGVRDEEVLVASTGLIGVELPVALIRTGLNKIELSPEGGRPFARAIITTDKHPKEFAVTFHVDGRDCVIAAAGKGSGMIHPNMATMLCFITTDAAVERPALQAALSDAADRSFNLITVDGDTSTNDMVIALANGLAGNRPIQPGTPEAQALTQALGEVCVLMAKDIARDGEGATKLLEVTVEGAASLQDARRAARTIAGSPLVKAAAHGADPNWGRVIAALGRSGAEVDESKAGLYMNDICMFDGGAPVSFFRDWARESMQAPEVRIRVRLGLGPHNATAWGCDLSEEYVSFNSEYTT